MEIAYRKQDQDRLEKNFLEACKNQEFVSLIKKVGLTKEEAQKKTSKLEETINELNHCKECKGLYECKNVYLGHVSYPQKEENMIHFTYLPCRYKKEEIKQRKSETKVNEQARMKDIDVTDKKRVKVIKWLDKFYEKYDFSKPLKGLYLHGNFGCGKSFLIGALLNELKEKKNVSTEMIYFPEILRELKSDWELYEAKMHHYETVDILCIDDIGAEKVTDWSRDEVLGTILQTRMNRNLTTFFTSNLTMEELENHFLGKQTMEDKINARRIMERIKQLTEDMELISENRRK